MEDINNQVKFSAMQTGKPYKKYGKTIMGKVHVVALNPFTEQPEGVILEGSPDGPSSKCFIEVWDPKADTFFKRLNEKHFAAGRLVEIDSNTEAQVERSVNDVTNDELDVLLNSKFLALRSALDKFSSEAPVFRLLNRAKELEKSEKIIKRIEERLAELQGIIVPEKV